MPLCHPSIGCAGEQGLIPEADIAPVEEVTTFENLPAEDRSDPSLLKQLAIVKLNGGLGTGMGLAGPKSLLKVRGQDTFLDFIARQVLSLRDCSGTRAPAFYLMNSFSTRSVSLDYLLPRYPKLGNVDGSLDFVQSQVPKLDPDRLTPCFWPSDPALEWCPPGHGDLYPSLLGNDRLLERWLAAGIRILFVSNADNLGATVDPRLLRHFIDSGSSFLMEVAQRTDMDRKGGHLACRTSDGRLVLRELAQCPGSDVNQFQDIQRHHFFNTNNLWINLEHLQDELSRRSGILSLPLIRNLKPIDPTDERSPRVLQLESAMGAAIECFDDAQAVVVPRSRFAPVKTSSDLLTVRSDAYVTDEDRTVLTLAPARGGIPPVVSLDPAHYKLVGSLDSFFPAGPPSLIDARALRVSGPVRFNSDTVVRGDVEIVNQSQDVRPLPAGAYHDERIVL